MIKCLVKNIETLSPSYLKFILIGKEAFDPKFADKTTFHNSPYAGRVRGDFCYFDFQWFISQFYLPLQQN